MLFFCCYSWFNLTNAINHSIMIYNKYPIYGYENEINVLKNFLKSNDSEIFSYLLREKKGK